MFKIRVSRPDKYVVMELTFFAVIFIVMSTLYNVEHLLKFPKEVTILPKLPNLVYHGFMNFFICILYYWLFLKKLIYREQWSLVVLSAVIFSVVKSFWFKYVTVWMSAQLPVFEEVSRNDARSSFKVIGIHIDFAYAMNSSFLIMVGCAYVIKSIQQKEQIEAAKNQQLISELTYLKAQLQPHFFFNTLNNIYGLAIRQSTDTAPMIARLSEMMRYIIYKADADKVPLRQEVDFIANYVEIEKIRHSKEIEINFDVQGDVDNYEIEPLLLLPIIENAFKHGLEDESKNGRINMVLCVIDDEIHLELENSIPERKKKLGIEGGLGLKNLRKRIELLYPGRYDFTIKQEEKMYSTTLRLTLQ